MKTFDFYQPTNLQKGILKQCANVSCGDWYTTNPKREETIFCSRSCQRAVHLLSAAELLKKREGEKYKDLMQLAEELGIECEYEYELPGTSYIYDFALLDYQVLLEFDGPDHARHPKRLHRDRLKDGAARSRGWLVFRYPTEPNAVIRPERLLKVIHSLVLASTLQATQYWTKLQRAA